MCAVAIGMVLGAVPGAPAAEPRQDRLGGDGAGTAGEVVTIVTGDQVTVHDGQVRSVRAGEGREGMPFRAVLDDGRQYVVPADAMGLVASGRVDRRLFDVTTLLEFGYDDAHRDSVPLVVTGQGARTALRDAATRDLPAVDGIALDAGKQGDTWRRLTGPAARGGVEKIWLDGKRRATLDHSVPQIGVPAAWAAGYLGAGTTVAVLDTGVDQSHPDLADRETAERNFTETPDNLDHAGHGTHVASIVAGTGARSGGKYRGVAPEAAILDGKVLDDAGFGQESWIIAGMQWAAEQGADIANLSLGGGDTPELDPLEEAVNTLSAEYGTLFVIAAGNSGGDETVSSPGSADAALTVGAVDRDDELARFSSRGPRRGDGAIKPDVTAPGVEIVAAQHSDATIGTPVEPGYTALSGTSMATPHVAGAAALLAQQHPDWTGARLKGVLSASAAAHPDLTAFEQGAGRIDVTRAITQEVVSEPTSVSFGVAQWPHEDDEPIGRSFSYRNLGAEDVTLSLVLDIAGPGGAAPPAGMFTASATEVTVPAGGTAEVTVTADTRLGGADGYYTGAVVATGGDTVVRTPVAVEREVESYDLTLTHLDENGEPNERYYTTLIGLDTDASDAPYDADGTVRTRLPKGTYLLDSTVLTTRDGADHFNLLTKTDLVLDEDTALTIDPRVARPIEVTPPTAATLVIGDLGYGVETEDGSYAVANLTDDLGIVSTAHLGAPMPGTAFTAKINTQWAAADGSFYGLAYFPHGAMPTGFTKVVSPSELATVRADLGSPVPDRTGRRVYFPSPAVGVGFVFGAGMPVPLPGERTEYLTTDNVVWTSRLTQLNGESEEAMFSSPLRRYQAGRTYSERVNHGMFGPTLPDDGFAGGWLYRYGDELIVEVPLFGDGAGNAGFSVVDSAVTRLYRGDELIGESRETGGFFTVPPEEADYRVTVEARRPDIFDVTTAVSAEWTFRSGHVGEEIRPLDVSVVRFFPRLDETNSAPAGRPYLIPVLAQHNGGDLTRPRDLAVEVSYDEGRTWRPADVLLNLVVAVRHPADATSVSLRASATDSAGNTVRQTVIRAYKLRK